MKQPSLHIDPGQNRFWTTCFEPAANETERIYKNSHQSRKSGPEPQKRFSPKKTDQHKLHSKTSHQSRGERYYNRCENVQY